MMISKIGGAAAIFLVLSGCASVTGGALVKNNEPVGRLIVENQSGVGLDALTLSRCNAMSHGLNRFSGGQQINNGGSMTFTLGAGCWDLMVGRTGTCSDRSCSWVQSPPKRFNLPAGGTQLITFTPQG